MILVSPIPGPEERNANFLLNAGAAVLVSKHFPIRDAIHAVFGQSGRLRHMQEAIANIARPDAAEKIGRFAIDLVERECGQ